MEVQIKTGTISQAIELDALIPEFRNTKKKSFYDERLKGKQALILIAWSINKPIGFKVGYQEEDYFYSWMGGVIPEYRNKGIATKLARYQEEWVKQNRIEKIRFKTQNKFKGMLIFALKNGFSILDTVPYDGGEGFKILLEKKII